MATYRKKPKVIEAVQLRWSNWDEVCELLGGTTVRVVEGAVLDDQQQAALDELVAALAAYDDPEGVGR